MGIVGLGGVPPRVTKAILRTAIFLLSKGLYPSQFTKKKAKQLTSKKNSVNTSDLGGENKRLIDYVINNHSKDIVTFMKRNKIVFRKELLNAKKK